MLLLYNLIENAPHAGGNYALLSTAGEVITLIISGISPLGSDVVGHKFLTNFNDY
jgi:hypothetical protein